MPETIEPPVAPPTPEPSPAGPGRPESSASTAKTYFNPEQDIDRQKDRIHVTRQFEEYRSENPVKAVHYAAHAFRAGLKFRGGRSEELNASQQELTDQITTTAKQCEDLGNADDLAAINSFAKAARMKIEIPESQKKLLEEDFTKALKNPEGDVDLSLKAMRMKNLFDRPINPAEMDAIKKNIVQQERKASKDNGSFDALTMLTKRARYAYLNNAKMRLNPAQHERIQQQLQEYQTNGQAERAARAAALYQKYFSGSEVNLSPDWLRGNVDRLREDKRWGELPSYLGDLRSLQESAKQAKPDDEVIVNSIVSASSAKPTVAEHSTDVLTEEPRTPGSGETAKGEAAAGETTIEKKAEAAPEREPQPQPGAESEPEEEPTLPPAAAPAVAAPEAAPAAAAAAAEQQPAGVLRRMWRKVIEWFKKLFIGPLVKGTQVIPGRRLARSAVPDRPPEHQTKRLRLWSNEPPAPVEATPETAEREPQPEAEVAVETPPVTPSAEPAQPSFAELAGRPEAVTEAPEITPASRAQELHEELRRPGFWSRFTGLFRNRHAEKITEYRQRDEVAFSETAAAEAEESEFAINDPTRLTDRVRGRRGSTERVAEQTPATDTTDEETAQFLRNLEQSDEEFITPGERTRRNLPPPPGESELESDQT